MTVADEVTGYEARAALEDMLERDMLGPWDGPTEELPAGTTPGERYLLGKLVPRRADWEEPVTDPEAAAEDDDVEDRPELVDEGRLDLDPDDAGSQPSPAAIRGRQWRRPPSAWPSPFRTTSTA